MPLVTVDLSPTSYRFANQNPMSEGMMKLQASIANGLTRRRELTQRGDELDRRDARDEERYQKSQQRLNRGEERQADLDDRAFVRGMNEDAERANARLPKGTNRHEAERMALDRLRLKQKTDALGNRQPFTSEEIESEIAQVLGGGVQRGAGNGGPDPRARLDEFGRVDPMADPDAVQQQVFDLLQPPTRQAAPAAPAPAAPVEDPEGFFDAVLRHTQGGVETVKDLAGGAMDYFSDDAPAGAPAGDGEVVTGATPAAEEELVLPASPEDVNGLAAILQKTTGGIPPAQFMDPLFSEDPVATEAALLKLPTQARAAVAAFLLERRTRGVVHAQ